MKHEQIKSDLRSVFSHPRISNDCLLNVIAEQHRLIRGAFSKPGGGRCIFGLLTEPLGQDEVLDKCSLTEFYGEARGEPGTPGSVSAKESEAYQPARWLVRLWDKRGDAELVERYGGRAALNADLVVAVARSVLAERVGTEIPCVKAEQKAKKRIRACAPC